jgi:hypothetical protein
VAPAAAGGEGGGARKGHGRQRCPCGVSQCQDELAYHQRAVKPQDQAEGIRWAKATCVGYEGGYDDEGTWRWNVQHWYECDFIRFSSTAARLGPQRRPPRARLLMTKEAARVLPTHPDLQVKQAKQRVRSVAAAAPGRRRCPCRISTCDDDLRDAGASARLPHDRADALRQARTLFPELSSRTLEEAIDTSALPTGEQFKWFGKRHWYPTDLEDRRHGGAVSMALRCVKEGAVPRQTPYENWDELAAAADISTLPRTTHLYALGAARGVLGEGTTDVEKKAIEDVAAATVKAVEVRLPVACADDGGEGKGDDGDIGSSSNRTILGPFDLIETMKADPSACRAFTGEPSFEVLVARWELYDADGAFSDLRQYHGNRDIKAKESPVSGKQGRRPVLSPWLQFIFHIIAHHAYSSRGRFLHLCKIFNIEYQTGMNYYKTWTLAVARFSQAISPPATRSQAALVVPTSAQVGMNMPVGSAPYMGDATEVWVDDPCDAALHSALWSQYKQHTTLKYVVITTFDSYVSSISEAFCGGATDNGAHIHMGVPSIL